MGKLEVRTFLVFTPTDWLTRAWSPSLQVCNGFWLLILDPNKRLPRGYPIEQLAVNSSHLETAYLLIYGVLPTKNQLNVWQQEIMHHSVVHADAEGFFRSFRCV